MAVTSLLTSLEDMEGSPTIQDYGGGQGASTNTDVFIEGSQSVGRRVDNTTDKGQGVSFTNVDLSAANEHIKIWCFVTQWPSVTQVQVRISDDTNDDDHDLPSAEFPALGGFIPIWVDVSRAPEVGGSANEASIGEVGILIDIGDVGGNAQNLIIDEVMHGTSGLRWTGTGPGDMADFRSFEDTNNEGNVVSLNGIDFCYSRLEIGNGATESDFTDSGFTLVFPDQGLVSSTFMGVSIHLGNASSVIDISNSTIQSSDPSAATNRPDLLVTGTSGSCDFDTVNFIGLRIIDLTSEVTATDCLFTSCGQVDATSAGTTGADLSGSSILSSIVAADEGALLWDVNEDPDTKTDGMTFSQGSNNHHAIRFGTSIPADITLRDCAFNGFSSTADADGATFRFDDTSGTITLNLVNCTVDGAAASSGNIGIDDAAGVTVNLVIDPVTTQFTVEDRDGNAIENARVLAETADDGGGSGFPFEDSVSITQSSGTATVTHTAHGLDTNDYVVIRGAQPDGYNKVAQITVSDANTYTYTVDSGLSSPATGTPISSYAPIGGVLTNASGVVSSSKTWPASQGLKGWARKKNAATPFYKDGDITVADASGGTDQTIVLQPDE